MDKRYRDHGDIPRAHKLKYKHRTLQSQIIDNKWYQIHNIICLVYMYLCLQSLLATCVIYSDIFTSFTITTANG